MCKEESYEGHGCSFPHACNSHPLKRPRSLAPIINEVEEHGTAPTHRHTRSRIERARSDCDR